MKKIFLFGFFTIIPLFLCIAQTPVIKNYSPIQYNGSRSNWDAAKDSLNLLYVGNNYGLLVFDGSNWKSYPVPGRTVRALESAPNGNIFWGSANDFGYLSRGQNGNLTIISLKKYISEQLKSPATIFQIITGKDEAYFETQNGFIIYHYLSEKVTFHPFNVDGSIIVDSELIDNTLFVISDNGLYQFSEQTFRPILTGSDIQPSNFYSILPYSQNRYLIVDELEGIYTVNKKFSDKQFLPESNNKLLTNSRLYLTSKAVSVGTEENPRYEYLIVSFSGLFHINQQGKLLRHYSTDNGLISNSVMEVLVDELSFWVSTDAGISQISRSELVKVFHVKESIASTFYSAHYREPLYYVGTKNGVLVKHDTSTHFSFIPESNHQFWDFINFESGVLAAGGNGGIYYLENGKITRNIPTETATMTIYQLSSVPSVVIAGMYSGAAILDTSTPEWKFTPLPVVDGTIQSISEDRHQNIWIGTRYDGLYKISGEAFSEDSFTSDFITSYRQKDGVVPDDHHNIFVFQDTLISTTSTGFLYFDADSDRFEEFRKSIGQYSYPKLIQLSDTTFLLNDDTQRMLVTSHSDGTISTDENYFNAIPGNITDIDQSGNNRFLVTTSTNVYEMTLNGKNVEIPSDLWFSFSSTDKTDGIRTFKFSHTKPPKLDFPAGKQISVTFSLPNQEIQSAVAYRYRLSSTDTVWSAWSKQSRLSWQSLPSGDHLFEVEVLKPNGARQQFAAIPFSIDYKWYNRTSAYVLYIVTGGLLIWGFINVRQRRLIKRNTYLENLVSQRTLEITQQNQQLVEANKIKSHYLNMAVHDLKNPLGAIKGFTELIEEERENPGHIQAYAEQILKVTHRMLSHIEQLLETERKQIKRQKNQFKHVFPATVISNVVDQNEFQAKQKNQTITTKLDDSLQILGDQLQLFQLVDNLLSNAIKFSPANTTVSITLKEEKKTKTVLMSISDEGPGIDPKYHNSIFEPWSKTNNQPTGDETSNGLGLTIVKEIAEMHNAEIRLVPRESGTTFEIRFFG